MTTPELKPCPFCGGAPKADWVLAWHYNRNKFFEMYKAFNEKDGTWWDHFGERCNPTHWMPLPPAPEA